MTAFPCIQPLVFASYIQIQCMGILTSLSKLVAIQWSDKTGTHHAIGFWFLFCQEEYRWKLCLLLLFLLADPLFTHFLVDTIFHCLPTIIAVCYTTCISGNAMAKIDACGYAKTAVVVKAWAMRINLTWQKQREINPLWLLLTCNKSEKIILSCCEDSTQEIQGNSMQKLLFVCLFFHSFPLMFLKCLRGGWESTTKKKLKK